MFGARLVGGRLVEISREPSRSYFLEFLKERISDKVLPQHCPELVVQSTSMIALPGALWADSLMMTRELVI